LHSLTLTSILGLVLVLIVGREHLPTNSIPWAGAIAMVGLFLLHGATLLARQRLEVAVWGMGAASAVAAVLASGSRGAYGIVPWAVLWLIWHKRRAISRSKFAIAIVVSAVAVTGLLNTTLIQTPYSRVITAVAEWHSSLESQSDWQNSSVGARISLWRLAEHAVPSKPWLGYGHDERLNLIHQWGKDHNSKTVTSLGHMHNQYLHDLMDHGLVGLSSTLIYLFGLTGLAAWLLKRKQAFAGWTLGGVAFIHATTSLTNVNFAHNYYPTIMSIVVGLALLGGRQEHARASDR
jgi:O-antigen ligase